MPAPAMDPVRWLAARDGAPRLFWSARGEGAALAGVGAALTARGARPDLADGELGPVLRLLRRSDHPSTRIFGRLCFDSLREASREWVLFGSFHLVLPRLELVSGPPATELACNLVLPRDLPPASTILAAIQGAHRSAAGAPLPDIGSRRDVPGVEEWREMIDEALRQIDDGSLEKVVLARRAGFRAAAPIDPFELLRRLGEVTPGCFHFAFAPDAQTAFIGASPEQLYRRDGRRIRSEAVAGTRPRGSSESHDRRLREELLGSDKDQREHDLVRVSIRDALRPLCTELRVDAERPHASPARGRIKVKFRRSQKGDQPPNAQHQLRREAPSADAVVGRSWLVRQIAYATSAKRLMPSMVRKALRAMRRRTVRGRSAVSFSTRLVRNRLRGQGRFRLRLEAPRWSLRQKPVNILLMPQASSRNAVAVRSPGTCSTTSSIQLPFRPSGIVHSYLTPIARARWPEIKSTCLTSG
ncbi:MAG: chorismate-binding protein [Gemmatimonadaceae bacterium]